MPTAKIAYSNLKAEMARKNIYIQDIANILGVSRDTAGRKLSRKNPLSLDEAFVIVRSFFPDQEVCYLFSEAASETQPTNQEQKPA